MNKTQLIDELAKHFNGNKSEAARSLTVILDTIMNLTAEGNQVMISGFGSFERVARDEREVRNPATGQWKHVQATFVPRFRAGSVFKSRVASP